MKPRVVLLTGSCGRLGAAFCERYYDDYTIIGVNRSKKSNFAHHFIQADITTQAEEIVKKTLIKFKRIDLLINNAAIYNVKPLEEMTQEEMLDVYRTNVVAPHWLSIMVLKHFWSSRTEKNKEKNRNIINVSSISGDHVYSGQGVYGPSKSALNMLTLHQATEFERYNIRVNVLAPGSFPSTYLSTEDVVDALVEIDHSDENGMIKYINPELNL